MARIMLDQAQPGMILEQPVANTNGRVLLPAGCEINEKHIKAMKMWGIVDLCVKGGVESDDSQASAVSPEKLEMAREFLAEAFKHANSGTPIMDAIYAEAIAYHARTH